mgnify:CR=1 FL=1
MSDTTKRIIWNHDNGCVAVTSPVEKSEATIEEIIAKAVPSGKSYQVVDVSVIPTDRSFRDAWAISGSTIVTDMAKAKEIHRAYIRSAREQKLSSLDIEFQKALETSADTSAIVAKKNALRDAPADSAIDAATDTDALKAQWDTSILGDSPYS